MYHSVLRYLCKIGVHVLTVPGDKSISRKDAGSFLSRGTRVKVNHRSVHQTFLGQTYASKYLTQKRNAASSQSSPFHAQKSSLSNASFLSPASTIAPHLSSI